MMAHTSAGILALATQHGFPLDPSDSTPISDEQFAAFVADYRSWSARRDIGLWNHISANPTLFRAFVQRSPRVYALIGQTAWYLDEIIMRDPVHGWVTDESADLETRKTFVKQHLQVLARVSGILESGLLLLYGAPIVGNLPDPPPELLDFVGRPDIRRALEDSCSCHFGRLPASDGTPVGVYEIRTETGGTVSFDMSGITLKPDGSISTPAVSIPTGLPPISAADLRGAVLGDPFERVAGLLAQDVQHLLAAVEGSRKTQAALLVDRPVDGLIIRESAAGISRSKQLAAVGVMNAALPYVRDVDPGRLQDLRERLPNAFRDFRSELHSIVAEAMDNDEIDGAELRARIDRRVLPRIAALDAEMTAEARAARLTGYGVPIVTGMASVVGSALAGGGVLVPALLGIAGAASLTASVKAAADYAKAATKAKANPFYFLWRAQ